MSGKALVAVSLSYAPLLGGAERQLRALAEGWAAEGREIWVVTRRLPGLPREETLGGVKVRRLP